MKKVTAVVAILFACAVDAQQTPDPRKARLDLIEKSVTSGNLP